MPEFEEEIKSVALNIMLLESDCTLINREEYIENYSERNIINGGSVEDNYFLYKNGSFGNKPAWVKEFDEKIWEGEIKNAFANTAAEGLSVIKQVNYNDEDYLFAINFGQGRHNIKKHKIEDTFGIYTAINLISKGATIRRAGTRNISSNPKNTEFQNAQEVTREELNAELEDNDIIRHLNATADTQTIGSVIGKYGPLNIRMRFKESEIPCWQHLDARLVDLLTKFNEVLENEEMANNFFKGLRPLPRRKQNELNELLPQKLNAEDSKFFLFEPEIDYDPTLVSSIKYDLSGTRGYSDEYENLDLNDYLNLRTEVTYNALAFDKAVLINECQAPNFCTKLRVSISAFNNLVTGAGGA